jgi:hypothetical protein
MYIQYLFYQPDVAMELEYITEEDEYSISEFYDKFHTDLPQVVQVSHDCQDNEVENEFVTGEVNRFWCEIFLILFKI